MFFWPCVVLAVVGGLTVITVVVKVPSHVSIGQSRQTRQSAGERVQIVSLAVLS